MKNSPQQQYAVVQARTEDFLVLNNAAQNQFLFILISYDISMNKYTYSVLIQC